MNPRQRRGLLLMAISALGLIVVFVLIAGYVADVREEVDPKVRLLELAKPVEAFQAITDDMVREVEMPARWAPPSALRDAGQLVGVVAATRLSKDSLLQEDMLVAPPQLAPGPARAGDPGRRRDRRRGQDRPRLRGRHRRDVPEQRAQGGRVARRRPERAHRRGGAPRVEGGRGVSEQDADPSQVVPVTFALTPEQVLVVSYAETNAAEVRLALLRAGDESELTPKQRKYSREPDPEPAQ